MHILTCSSVVFFTPVNDAFNFSNETFMAKKRSNTSKIDFLRCKTYISWKIIKVYKTAIEELKKV